jgi:hypothetical protein
LKKSYFSSHKLPKQQSTSFWSHGILGVNNIWKDQGTSRIQKNSEANAAIGGCLSETGDMASGAIDRVQNEDVD